VPADPVPPVATIRPPAAPPVESFEPPLESFEPPLESFEPPLASLEPPLALFAPPLAGVLVVDPQARRLEMLKRKPKLRSREYDDKASYSELRRPSPIAAVKRAD